MIEWKRTGNKEYPENDQECLIYFHETGYSISKFNWEEFVDGFGVPCPEMGKIACFSDKGGYLGDEDLLWMPIADANGFPEIPDSYKNDKKFKKWDDPDKIYRYVFIKKDFHYVRNPLKIEYLNHWELDIPMGSKIGITSDKAWKNNDILGEGEYVWQCVYDDGSEKHLIYISEDNFTDLVV